MNLIQQKQVAGLYNFIQNNAGGTTDGTLIDPSLVVYLSGDQTITGGKTFTQGITGESPSWLVWDSGNFNYLYTDQLYGVELTGDYGKIGSTNFTSDYLSGTQAIFTDRITGTKGFLFTGAHATFQTCDIHNTKLQIYSDLNAGTNNTAAIFGKNPNDWTPTISFASYSGDESVEAGYLRKTQLIAANLYSAHLNIGNVCPTGDIRFSTYGDNGGDAWYRIDEFQRMIIHSGGNVGIGVKGMVANQSIKPLEKLHVSGGNIRTDGNIYISNQLEVGADAYVSGELWITGNDGAPLQLTGNGGGGGASFTCTDMNGCSPTFVGMTGEIISGHLLKVGTDAYVSGELWITGADGAPLQLTGNGSAGGASFTCTDMNGCSPTFVGMTGEILSGNSLKVGGTTYSQAIIPDASGVWDLGTASNPWGDIYLTPASIYLGDQKLTATSGNLSIEQGGSTTSIPSMAVVDVTSTNAYTVLSSDNGKTIHVDPGNSDPTAITLPVGDSDFNNFKCIVRHLDSDDPYIGFKTSDDSAIEGSATGFSSNWAWASVYRGEGSWYIFGDPLVNRPAPSPTNPGLLSAGLMVRLFGWNDPTYVDNSDFLDGVSVNPGDGTPVNSYAYKSTIALPGGAYVTGVLNEMADPDPTKHFVETVTLDGFSRKAIQLDGTDDFISMPQLQNNADGNWDSDLDFIEANSSDDAEYGFTWLFWIAPSENISGVETEYTPFNFGSTLSSLRSLSLHHDFLGSERECHLKGTTNQVNTAYSNTMADPPAPWQEIYNQDSWTWIAVAYNGGPMASSSASEVSTALMVGVGTGDPTTADGKMFFYSGDGVGLDGDMNIKGGSYRTKGNAGDSLIQMTSNYPATLGGTKPLEGDETQWPGYISDFRIYNRDLSTGEMYSIFTGTGSV